MKNIVLCAAILAVIATSGAASAQFLAVPDSTADRIMTFDPFDGSLINADFITDAGGTPYDFGTPKDAILVGSEIWVADQISDAVFRFDTSGNYLSAIDTGLDNIRGMAYADGRVYVSNSGSNNGAPGDAVIMYAPDGTLQGNFLAGDPFDIYEYNGELLVAEIGGDDILRHAYDGTPLGVFHDSDGVVGIDFPQQISGRGANVIVGGFSTPSGLYEYDSSGAQVGFSDLVTGLRGVYELGNGNIMVTNGSGVHVIDLGAGTFQTVVAGASGQFINLIPEPATFTLLALGALALRRR